MLALVGLSFLGLMGAAGLAVDVGYWYWQRVLLQQGADAGALAGAKDISNQTIDQYHPYSDAKARAYIRHNGCDPATEVESIVYTPRAGTTPPRVTVILLRNVGTFFLSVFGARTVPIRARSVAEASETINGFEGTLGGRTAIDYAVFSGSETEKLDITGNRKHLFGDVHSNSAAGLNTGNNHDIHGDVTAVGSISHDTSKVDVTGDVLPGSAAVNDDIIPISQIQSFADYKHLSGFEVNSQIPDGVYYIEGDLHINFNISGKVSFVATGHVHINSNVGTLSANSAIGIVSLASAPNKGIHINVNNANIKAFLFAPYGEFKGAGNDWQLEGGIAANTYGSFAGNDITVRYGAAQAAAIPTTPTYGEHVHLIE